MTLPRLVFVTHDDPPSVDVHLHPAGYSIRDITNPDVLTEIAGEVCEARDWLASAIAEDAQPSLFDEAAS